MRIELRDFFVDVFRALNRPVDEWVGMTDKELLERMAKEMKWLECTDLKDFAAYGDERRKSAVEVATIAFRIWLAS